MFSIVPSTGRYDVLGMRQGGKTMATVAAPGEPGWLGNPYVAVDAGGTLSRAEATDRFKRLIFQRAKDPAWADAFRALRGKTVGYYKPNEQDIHLHALQDWLSYDAGQPVIRNGMINWLPDDSVFVFGSNAAGRHGKGAAATAAQRYGAQMGVGEGLTGRAYALPTKDGNLNTLSLDSIAQGLTRLGQSARENPGKKFYLTRIGQGLAGIPEEQIRPLVEAAGLPENVLPWWNWEGGGATSSVGDVLDAALAPARTYELSRAGDGRFSAFNARIRGRGDRTIEELYQVDGKGYPSISAGKGKPPLTANFDSEGFYEGLWREWAAENPDLMNELTGLRQQGYNFTDKFAGRSRVNQASTLTKLADELLSAPAATTAADVLDAAIAPASKGFYAGIGSRKTPEAAWPTLKRIAAALEAAGYGLRSGGADGADRAFESGVSNPSNKRIYLPWNGFGNAEFTDPGMVDASELPGWAAAQEAVNRYHPNPGALTPAARNLHARNTFQVLGDNLEDPSKFVLAWAREPGGTDQALRVAEENGVPIVNLGKFGMLAEAEKQLDAGTFLDWVLGGAPLPDNGAALEARGRTARPVFYADNSLFQAGIPVMPGNKRDLIANHALGNMLAEARNLKEQKIEFHQGIGDTKEVTKGQAHLKRLQDRVGDVYDLYMRPNLLNNGAPVPGAPYVSTGSVLDGLLSNQILSEQARGLLASGGNIFSDSYKQALVDLTNPNLPLSTKRDIYAKLGDLDAQALANWESLPFAEGSELPPPRLGAKIRSAIKPHLTARQSLVSAVTGPLQQAFSNGNSNWASMPRVAAQLGDPRGARLWTAQAMKTLIPANDDRQLLLQAIIGNAADSDALIAKLGPDLAAKFRQREGKELSEAVAGGALSNGAMDVLEGWFDSIANSSKFADSFLDPAQRGIKKTSWNEWARMGAISKILENHTRRIGLNQPGVMQYRTLLPGMTQDSVPEMEVYGDSGWFGHWFAENFGDPSVIDPGNEAFSGNSRWSPFEFKTVTNPATGNSFRYLARTPVTGKRMPIYGPEVVPQEVPAESYILDVLDAALSDGDPRTITTPRFNGQKPRESQWVQEGQEYSRAGQDIPGSEAPENYYGDTYNAPGDPVPDTRTKRFTGRQTSWGYTDDPEVAAMQARSEALDAAIQDSMNLVDEDGVKAFDATNAPIIPPSEGQIAEATSPISFSEVYEPGTKEYALQDYIANTKLKPLRPGQRPTGTEQYAINQDGSRQLLDRQAEYLAERIQRGEMQSLENAAARQEVDALANEAGMPRADIQTLSETRPLQTSYEADRAAMRAGRKLSAIQEVVDQASVQAARQEPVEGAMTLLRRAILNGLR